MTCVEKSGIPFDDGHPLVFGDAKDWNQLSRTRGDWLREQRSRLTPAEMEIQKALKTEVDVKFENRPLSEVVETLGRMAGVNVFLDPQGLHAEGITTDEPVRINLTQPISLRSALNLILEPLHLSYVIQNEVLRVTSEQTRDANVYPRVYNVADLVIPIPNFIPSYNIGLPGALKEAINATGQVRSGGFPQTVPLTLAANDARPAGGDQRVRVGADELLRDVARRRVALASAAGLRSREHGRRHAGRFRHADRSDHHHHRPADLGHGGRSGHRSRASRPTSAWSSARRRTSTSRSSTCWNSCAACRTCR